VRASGSPEPARLRALVIPHHAARAREVRSVLEVKFWFPLRHMLVPAGTRSVSFRFYEPVQ
jgi:hypothetical protein